MEFVGQNIELCISATQLDIAHELHSFLFCGILLVFVDDLYYKYTQVPISPKNYVGMPFIRMPQRQRLRVYDHPVFIH